MSKYWQPLAMEGRIDENGHFHPTAVSLVDKSCDPYAGYWAETIHNEIDIVLRKRDVVPE